MFSNDLGLALVNVTYTDEFETLFSDHYRKVLIHVVFKKTCPYTTYTHTHIMVTLQDAQMHVA